ncbi:MAG: prepilin-type N-terminal cleavage/methylation domain-containing protein [Gemmataceae bacterium]|nr:prepilin-type N-terminal cleavage/methylation domain-containing protein [Gemmataceae bacterium]
MRLPLSSKISVRSGMTLVEIATVIAIISTLSTLSFFAFTSAKRFADGIEQRASSAMIKIAQASGTKGSVPTPITNLRPRPTWVPGSYFINFSAGVKNPNSEASRLASLVGGRVSKVYTAGIYGFVLNVGNVSLASLAVDPAVKQIDPMPYIYGAAVPNNIKRVFCNGMAMGQDTAASTTIFAVPTNIYSMYKNTELQATTTGRITLTGTTSASIPIAILDTGIDTTHGDLFVVFQQDFTTTAGVPNNNPIDLQGHGTHVAGVIGAIDQSAGAGVVGVYPGAPLYNLKVMNGTVDDVFAGTTQDVLDALTFVIANASTIRICLMPFSTAAVSAQMNALVDMAANSGVLMVAAAGNGGVNVNTVSPASASQAIRVGAMVDTNGKCGVTAGLPDEIFALYSNTGALDFVAPGGTGLIPASVIRSTTANPLNRYSTEIENLSGTTGVDAVGTSFAAAHVAGLLGLVLDPQTSIGYVVGRANPTYRFQMFNKATAVASLRALTHNNTQFQMVNPLTNSAWLVSGGMPKVVTAYRKRFNNDIIGGFPVPNFFQNPIVAPSNLTAFPG